MFDYIKGRVVHKTPTAIVIETNGIGYKIHIPLSTFERITDKEKVKILTRLIISKDFEVKVYGFSSLEERKQIDKLVNIDASIGNESLSKPISELTLSTRCKNALEKMEIKTIGDLVSKTEDELLRRRGFKQAYIDEIKVQLEKHGFQL